MQTLWKFAKSLPHEGLHDGSIDPKGTNLNCTRCRLEDWAVAWNVALLTPRLKNYPPELTKAEIYLIEAVLGVPEERRRK